ncbi:MAG TPA: tRNA (guanosine(46)-N7)-methyltransferase TrmB [Caldimonas sp.]|jgi:tRNA (guanine-N7-)-methyltransferase
MRSPDPGQDEKTREPAPRPIRSFVVRAGRMGPGQARALASLSSRYVVPFADAPLDFAALFGRVAPVVVEIGFGMGAATAAIAAATPAVDYLGIEVHPPGVGALLQRIDEARLGNVRIVSHDAVEVLGSMIAPRSLAGIHVFFPDPWPKKRHHKRRLIQPDVVSLLASRLAAGATLHCATDWEPYAEQMLAVLAAEPSLVNAAGSDFAARPPGRPLTKFEQRGLALGHGVRDLVFAKRA